MTERDMNKVRERLRERIAAQDAERGRPLTATEKLANLKAALSRCDQCDNAIEPIWNFCAWCGWDLVGASGEKASKCRE